MNLRLCHHCGERKPNEAFGVEPLYCRACVAAYHRERRARYREIVSAVRPTEAKVRKSRKPKGVS
jgi:hypothetical protein